MAATKIKEKHPGIKVVTYFLDPLAGATWNRILGEKKSAQRTGKIEKEIIEKSDLLIAQHEHKIHFEKQYNKQLQSKVRYLGVPLLSDNTGWFSKTMNTGNAINKRVVLYAGALSSKYRDPTYIIRAFAFVKSARLVIYVSNGEEWVKKIAENNNNVEVHGRVSHETIVAEMQNADAFLNIGNNLELQAPSKLIEYISYGKPIVSSLKIENDTSQNYLLKYPMGIIIDERVVTYEAAAAQIDTLIENRDGAVSYECLKKAYYTNTPEAFIEMLNSVYDYGE